MPRRKVLAGLLLAAGSLVASVLFRRRAARRLQRVDLYFEDGSMVSLTEGSADAERLLPLARAVLAAAR